MAISMKPLGDANSTYTTQSSKHQKAIGVAVDLNATLILNCIKCMAKFASDFILFDSMWGTALGFKLNGINLVDMVLTSHNVCPLQSHPISGNCCWVKVIFAL